MRSVSAFLGGACLISGASLASAAEPPPTTQRAVPAGLVVLATQGASDAAWPLARRVYAHADLRPRALDEAQARVLAGEAAPDGASPDLRDLAETRGAIRGDDAPSRQLLASIAHRFQARGIVVVSVVTPAAVGGAELEPGVTPPPPPATAPPEASARVFLTAGGAFDAARYAPDAWPASGAPDWSNTVSSLRRAHATSTATPSNDGHRAVALASDPTGDKKPGEAGNPFYASGWFWGAIGAAVVTGAAIFFATRDPGADTIHLQMQVPR